MTAQAALRTTTAAGTAAATTTSRSTPWTAAGGRATVRDRASGHPSALSTGERLLRSSTLLLNASYEVLAQIETIRAMTMLVAEQVVVLRAEPDRFVHSAHLTLPWPTIVAMKRYVHVPHDVRSAGSEVATRAQILERDRRTCAYCGGRGTTIDHVLPQSRGGGNTWSNLVAACAPCNNLKADRTPDEAGMPLLFEPARPATEEDLQRLVWELLSAT